MFLRPPANKEKNDAAHNDAGNYYCKGYALSKMQQECGDEQADEAAGIKNSLVHPTSR